MSAPHPALVLLWAMTLLMLAVILGLLVPFIAASVVWMVVALWRLHRNDSTEGT